METVTVALPTMGKSPADLSLVEAEINKLLADELGIQVHLLAYNGSTYARQVALGIRSGNAPDIATTPVYDILDPQDRANLLPLDNHIEAYGQELVDSVPKFYLDACRIDGALYALPTAMRLLNLLYSNAALSWLLFWGIEGVHYEVLPDGLIRETEHHGAYTHTFHIAIGNLLLYPNWEYEGADYYQNLIWKCQESDKVVDIPGFHPQLEGLDAEIKAIDAACAQYLSSLMLGAVDPETELPRFRAALRDAGLPAIIEEKQRQLAAFQSKEKANGALSPLLFRDEIPFLRASSDRITLNHLHMMKPHGRICG